MYPLKIKEKYDQSNLNSLWHRFTVVYLGNYIPGNMDEEWGSHPWVDIVPERKWQEVFSVLDWTVFKCWEDWAYWKYVFIEHKNVPHPDDFSKTTTLYSCYEHLSEFWVKLWDTLKEWDMIWKTWNTWNSFWEHLHFQIDRQEAPYHAYWPYTWAEAKEAWVGFSEWVNKWLWKDKAKMYTINPLVYLDKVSSNTSIKVEEKKIEEVKISSSNTIVVEEVKTTSNVTPVVDKIESKPVEVIETIKTTTPEVIANNTPTLEAIKSSNSWDDIVKSLDVDSLLSDKKKL